VRDSALEDVHDLGRAYDVGYLVERLPQLDGLARYRNDSQLRHDRVHGDRTLAGRIPAASSSLFRVDGIGLRTASREERQDDARQT
jgi:hypothetical protein